MSKWKCEICGLEFENFHAQGFNHKIYCPLCYYKELYKINTKEIDRLNNIINDVYEFVEWHYKDNQKFYKNKGIGLNYPECDYILYKLKELKENNNV